MSERTTLERIYPFFIVKDLAEYQSCGLALHETLADTSDGLRAFELKDHDSYVLCFGKPL